jgi:hypothetical protein
VNLIHYDDATTAVLSVFKNGTHAYLVISPYVSDIKVVCFLSGVPGSIYLAHDGQTMSRNEITQCAVLYGVYRNLATKMPTVSPLTEAFYYFPSKLCCRRVRT